MEAEGDQTPGRGTPFDDLEALQSLRALTPETGLLPDQLQFYAEHIVQFLEVEEDGACEPGVDVQNVGVECEFQVQVVVDAHLEHRAVTGWHWLGESDEEVLERVDVGL